MKYYLSILYYKLFLTLLTDSGIEITGANDHSAEEARLFAGNYLYAIYFVYRAVFGRIAQFV